MLGSWEYTFCPLSYSWESLQYPFTNNQLSSVTDSKLFWFDSEKCVLTLVFNKVIQLLS